MKNRLVAAWWALRGRVEVPKVVYQLPEPRWVQLTYWRDELLALDNLGQVWLINANGRGEFVVQCPPILTTPRRY